MNLTFREYKAKLNGCWLGKNIGGILGAPFEGTRGVRNIDFYAQNLSGEPPANDDLDLQLVWLNAVEEHGRHVNASILGDYWLTYIVPDWVEYGVGKSNLKMGLVPPLSGVYENTYRNSNGCFIRSEIWACLFPGHPEKAVRYAYEDGIVDHAYEGVYAELFCAAVQSAAFALSDTRGLIQIGLSYIPERCGVANAVRTVVSCYEEGLTWQEARIRVLTVEPCSFGVQWTPLGEIPDEIPAGSPGYDAPGNIGIVIIGWLYGGGDFGKSICIAANCGEDTDCTAATLGAILGIIGGDGSIPEKWRAPVGDAIATCCINRSNGGVDIPATVSELAERILMLAPRMLGREHIQGGACAEGGYTVIMTPPERMAYGQRVCYIPGINGAGKSHAPMIEELLESPFVVRYRFMGFDVAVDYIDGPVIVPGQQKKLRIIVSDNKSNQIHQWITLKWYAPPGAEVQPGRDCSFFLRTTYQERFETEFYIQSPPDMGARLELLADFSINSRHTGGTVKIVLIPQPAKKEANPISRIPDAKQS